MDTTASPAMSKKSSHRRLSQRKWTVQEQAIAEVAAACGVTLCEIGQYLSRRPSTVCRHLHPGRLEAKRLSSRRYLAAHPERKIWLGMISRCTNASARDYSNYGGRGIRVCERWINSFDAFLKDMGKRPTAQHTIERKNTNGNYEPGNCCWETNFMQQRNRRNNRRVSFRGREMILTDACALAGVSPETVWYRIKSGWPESEWFRLARHYRKRD